MASYRSDHYLTCLGRAADNRYCFLLDVNQEQISLRLDRQEPVTRSAGDHIVFGGLGYEDHFDIQQRLIRRTGGNDQQLPLRTNQVLTIGVETAVRSNLPVDEAQPPACPAPLSNHRSDALSGRRLPDDMLPTKMVWLLLIGMLALCCLVGLRFFIQHHFSHQRRHRPRSPVLLTTIRAQAHPLCCQRLKQLGVAVVHIRRYRQTPHHRRHRDIRTRLPFAAICAPPVIISASSSRRRYRGRFAPGGVFHRPAGRRFACR